MGQQGKEISADHKQCIISLKKQFDLEKKSGPYVNTCNSAGRVSEALCISKRSIEKVLSEYKKNGNEIPASSSAKRGCPPCYLGDNTLAHIRQHIQSLNLQGKHVSIRNLVKWLLDDHKVKVPTTTLWRSLNRIGFTYGLGKRRSALKERDYVLVARRKYLRNKIANRNENGTLKRPEVYLDETYLNKNHSSTKTWSLEEDGHMVNKPSGKGERLIILHAITQKGWVKGAKLVFQSNRVSGDYHGQMNYDNFSKWFSEQLIPNIPENSIIIMDNAKYHNVLAEDIFPTPRSKKEDLINWLIQNRPDISISDDMLRPELYDICKREGLTPKFRIDEIAEAHGHSILRTPQYHCELQPIEHCWGVLKDECRRTCDFTVKGMKKNLDKAFRKVTAATCKKVCAKIRKQEDTFWINDKLLDLSQTDSEKENNENYVSPDDCEIEMD
jgi:transposase